MVDGEGSPLQDDEPALVDAEAHDSQQARMRQEIEAERLSYRQKAHMTVPSAATAPQVQLHPPVRLSVPVSACNDDFICAHEAARPKGCTCSTSSHLYGCTCCTFSFD